MDRRWSIAAFGLLTAATASSSIPLREAQWIAPERQLFALTSQPSECVAETNLASSDVAAGRLIFGDPLLLGGQASRAGLSCASCHKNGRGNADFLFPGISGEAGTADVTSSLLSRMRGDGNFNPKRIPDLALDAAKIDRDPKRNDLHIFVTGLIVEEFDGLEPDPQVMGALLAYIRAIDRKACRAGDNTTISAEGDAADIQAALSLADEAIGDSKPKLAIALLSAARSRLGQMAERYAGSRFRSQREKLAGLSKRLGEIQADLRKGAASRDVQAALTVQEKRAGKTLERLLSLSRKSLYDPRQLEKRLSLPH